MIDFEILTSILKDLGYLDKKDKDKANDKNYPNKPRDNISESQEQSDNDE